MTQDFEEYRLKKGLSPVTVSLDVRIMRQVLSFINFKYKKSVEPHEIRPSDITDFLDGEVEKGHSANTIRLKLGVIRQWFDFMWQVGKIQYDFMPKLEYEDRIPESNEPELSIDYQKLLNLKAAFLADNDKSLIARMLLIFYMRGLRLRDVLDLTDVDFVDQGDSIDLHLITKSDRDVKITFTEKEEVMVLLGAIERAVFRGIPFIFNMKTKGEYVQMTYDHLGNFNRVLSEHFKMRIRSEDIRFAYIYHLYNVENKSLESISEKTGYTLNALTNMLKTALERIEKKDYTNEKTV